MVDRVLVASDGSKQAANALEFALERFPGAELTVIHVVDPVDLPYAGEGPVDPTTGERWEKATRVCEDSEALAAEFGRDVQTVSVVGNPAREIVSYASTADFDHVVVGSRGRTGISRLLLGSVAEQVLRRTPVPVTVVR